MRPAVLAAGVPACGAVPSSRRSVRAGAFPLFNPAPTPASLDGLVKAHPGWALKLEPDHGEASGPRLRHHFRTPSHEKAHSLLEAFQLALYKEGEKGCRIRRESQTKWSLCCEGVEALLNASHDDVCVDIPVDLGAEAALLAGYAAKMKMLQEVAAAHKLAH